MVRTCCRSTSTRRPLRAAILYGIDTRSTAEIEELNATFGAERLFELSGMALTSQAVGPKLRWLRNHEPEVYRQTRYVTTCSGYLVLKLTGEYVLDYHSASHFNPLFDLRGLAWSDRFADPIWDVERLPRLAWPTEVVGQVSPAAAAETGLRVGTPVTAGTIDAVAEALSVGVAQPGDMMVMYGTTFFFILVLDALVADPRLWVTAYAFPGRYCLSGGMSTTGALTRWFRDELAPDLLQAERAGGAAAYAALERRSEPGAAGARGLWCCPIFRASARPCTIHWHGGCSPV